MIIINAAHTQFSHSPLSAGTTVAAQADTASRIIDNALVFNTSTQLLK